jgi:hypothetical protein
MKKFSDESEVVKLFWVIESVTNVMMKNSLMMNWHKKKFDSKFLLLIQTSTDTNLSVSAISLSRIGELLAALSFPLAFSHCVSLHLFLCNWRISSKQADLSLSPSLSTKLEISASKQVSLSLSLSLSSSLSTKLEKFQQASRSLSLLPSLSPKLENFQQASRSLSLSLPLLLCLALVFLSLIGEFSASKNQHKMN